MLRTDGDGERPGKAGQVIIQRHVGEGYDFGDVRNTGDVASPLSIRPRWEPKNSSQSATRGVNT